MRKVALVVNIDKPQAVDAGRSIIAWLEARSVRPILQPTDANVVGRPDLAIETVTALGEAELLIVLGGDGTLIRAAQVVAPMHVPILGINTGHLGFLTELESGELFEHLEEFLDGNYVIEERLMIIARVERAGQKTAELTALNDAVISKGPRARLVHLLVSVNETVVARYPADGIIVATPTGSTAYSLSAGGPIVSPSVDVLLVTPICPHTMNARAVVVAGNEEVVVMVEDCSGEVGVSVDGTDPVPLAKGDLVRVTRAPFYARLVRRYSYRFYDVLRQKLSVPGR